MNTVCRETGCSKPVIAKELCGMHYRRLRIHGDTTIRKSRWADHEPTVASCSIDGCNAPVKAKSVCGTHYQRILRTGAPLGSKPRPTSYLGPEARAEETWERTREQIRVDLPSASPIQEWALETRAAYLACALDTDGWISLFQHQHGPTARLQANVGCTNQNVAFLQRLADIADVPLNLGLNNRVGQDARQVHTRAECWQAVWRSPLHVEKVLTLALPYLVAKQQRAAWVLEYARSRITDQGKVARSGRPYTPRDHELAQLVTDANKGAAIT